MLTEEWPGSAPRGKEAESDVTPAEDWPVTAARGTAAESDVTPIEKWPGTASWRGAVSLGPADDGSGATNRGSEALTCT
jgi:hypothetical protein